MSHAHFSVSFPEDYRRISDVLSAILSSSLATWFFLMGISEFGLRKSRIKRNDVARMPIPDLETIPHSEAGQRLVLLSRKLQETRPSDADWWTLDDAAFDLYGLNQSERIVVRDGLFRASWQWKSGKTKSMNPVSIQPHMLDYAHTFLATMDIWFAARKRRHMRTEIFKLPKDSPLRIVRFTLEEGHAFPKPEIIEPKGSLKDILDRISQRLDVRLAEHLYGQRELRVHGRCEVVIIKPNARRHWMRVSALEDADAVIVESFTGAAV